MTFHNGKEMMMDGVVWSAENMIRWGYPAHTERSKEFFGNVDRVEVVDATTLKIIPVKPEPLIELILAALQAMILPKDDTMALPGDPDVTQESDFIAFRQASAGTGRYSDAEFTPETRIVWQRFDGYLAERAPYRHGGPLCHA